MNRDRNLRSVWVGNAAHPEFAPIVAYLNAAALTPPRAVHATIDEFVQAAHGRTAEPPELVLVWQTWSDEFPRAAVFQLLREVPLTTVLCISSSWSESDGRTRQNWPPALRVPVWQAVSRLDAELTAHESGRAAVPWTASREEVWLWLTDSAHKTLRPLDGLRIHLDVPDAELQQTLAARLVAVNAVLCVAGEQADIVIADIDPWPVPAARLTHIRSHGDAPLVALSHWITPSLREELQQQGFAGVASKLSLGDLPELLRALPVQQK